MRITDNTMVRVERSVKISSVEGTPYGPLEFFCITTIKNLRLISVTNHREAEARVRSELERYPQSLVYDNRFGIYYKLTLNNKTEAEPTKRRRPIFPTDIR